MGPYDEPWSLALGVPGSLEKTRMYQGGPRVYQGALGFWLVQEAPRVYPADTGCKCIKMTTTILQLAPKVAKPSILQVI